jgi:hypothetical protein
VTAPQHAFCSTAGDFSPGKQAVCRYAFVNAAGGPVQGSLKSDRRFPQARPKAPNRKIEEEAWLLA